MKKVELVIPTADAEKMLIRLQKKGLMHVVMNEMAENEDLRHATARLVVLNRCLHDLKAVKKSAPAMQDSGEATDPDSPDVMELCETVASKNGDMSLLEAEVAAFQRELIRLRPWGDFQPSRVEQLAREGVHISLHQLSRRLYKLAESEGFRGRHVELVSETSSLVRFVEIRLESDYPESACSGNPEGEGATIPSPLFDYENLPLHGPGELNLLVQKAERRIGEIREELFSLVRWLPLVEKEIAETETRCEFFRGNLSLDDLADGHLKLLTGYVPLKQLSRLEDWLGTEALVPVISTPQVDDEVPVKLRNPWPARLFEPVTSIFGLPDYAEIDPTPFFAPFFALFFGLCLADVGYGIMVTLAAIAGLGLMQKGPRRSLSVLVLIFGLFTIAGGVMFNNFFGVRIDQIPNLPPGLASLLLFRDMNSAMHFAIMLGVVQVLAGLLMRTANSWFAEGIGGAAGSLANFLLLLGGVIWVVNGMGADFMVGPMPVGQWVAAITGGSGLQGLFIMALAVFILLFFSNMKMSLWLRPFAGLWDLYGIVTGVPGDIISYIRIFALALAGGLLGGAINLIAVMIRGDSPGLLAWFFTILVLILGHAVNFILAALGAFVHPLRLTFVEFYKAVGFKGGGKSYRVYGGA